MAMKKRKPPVRQSAKDRERYGTMDRKWKRKWINALRGGEYRQARGELRDHVGYCCLGVLCDISGAGEWTGTNGGRFIDFNGYDHSAVTPPGVKSLTGLTVLAEQELVELNDHKRYGFRRIATWIEKHL